MSELPEVRHVATDLTRVESGRMVQTEFYVPDPPPARPAWLLCDCCSQKKEWLELRRYPSFCIKVPGIRGGLGYAASTWAFCLQCRALFNARDVPLLIARVRTFDPGLSAATLETIYTALLYAVYGDPATWESGQPYPEPT